jgi:hypothetical protein
MSSLLFCILIVPAVNHLLQILLNCCVADQTLDMSACGLVCGPDCLENVGASTSHSPVGLHGLLQV